MMVFYLRKRYCRIAAVDGARVETDVADVVLAQDPHEKPLCPEAGPPVRVRPVLPLVRVPIGRQVELVRLGRSARSR